MKKINVKTIALVLVFAGLLGACGPNCFSTNLSRADAEHCANVWD